MTFIIRITRDSARRVSGTRITRNKARRVSGTVERERMLESDHQTKRRRRRIQEEEP